MSGADRNTIAALATPPGRGGVGVIRLSGPQALVLAQAFLGFEPRPRYAHYGPFLDETGDVLDEGIALYFPGPHSFTGEDVLELQGHGGPVLMDRILASATARGARLARPGEFSERAFLNDKLDLAQAEAIADLIESSSEQAARSALQSLQGAFSRVVSGLIEELVQLRVYVEAAIDFPDEDVDFLGDGKVAADLQALLESLDRTVQEAHQGTLLRDGMQVVIAGKPNAGKSSLLNALSGQDTAIVTEIEGTTRDVLREQIQIDGMPLHIIDTAGLRDSADEVERIGIDRAWAEIEKADRVLLLVDSVTTPDTDPATLRTGLPRQLPEGLPVTVLRNKADLSGETPGFTDHDGTPVIRLSAQSGEGVDTLREHLKDCMGYQTAAEGRYMARRRHLDALERARSMVVQGQTQLSEFGAGELLAEDLRQAQDALGEITGAMTPDELLGEIFSSFCIGK